MAVTETIPPNVCREHLDDAAKICPGDECVGSQIRGVTVRPFAPVERLNKVFFIACRDEFRCLGAQSSRNNTGLSVLGKRHRRPIAVAGLVAVVKDRQEGQEAADPMVRYCGRADFLFTHLEIPRREVLDAGLVGLPQLAGHACNQLLISERVKQNAVPLGCVSKSSDFIPVARPVFTEDIVP